VPTSGRPEQPTAPAHRARHTRTCKVPPAKPIGRDPKPTHPLQRLTGAERLKRTFEFDVTVCPLCSGTLRVIAG
jgi:hypothetical protein